MRTTARVASYVLSKRRKFSMTAIAARATVTQAMVLGTKTSRITNRARTNVLASASILAA